MLASCGSRVAVYNPSHMRWSGALVPPDIVVRDPVPPPLPTAGLYVDDAGLDTATVCCWIAPHADLTVRKRGTATALLIGTWLPNEERFKKHRQVLRVTFAGFKTKTAIVAIDPGTARTRVPIPPAMRARSGEFRIVIDTKYAMKAGPAKDALRYGAVLSSLYFE